MANVLERSAGYPATRTLHLGLRAGLVDRLTHHCHTDIIRGQSYRQLGRWKEVLTETPAPDHRPELDSWPKPR